MVQLFLGGYPSHLHKSFLLYFFSGFLPLDKKFPMAFIPALELMHTCACGEVVAKDGLVRVAM